MKTIDELLQEVAFHYERERPDESNEGLTVYEAKQAILELVRSKMPRKKQILDMTADIKDVGDYVRHKERVSGFNQAIEEMEKGLESL